MRPRSAPAGGRTWLNGGFATYAQWMWFEHTGIRGLSDSLPSFYDRFPAEDPFWRVVVGDPGRDSMFHPAVYLRDAMTLQVLRERIGENAFLTLLRTWHATYRGGNATTAQFVAMANTVAGQDAVRLKRSHVLDGIWRRAAGAERATSATDLDQFDLIHPPNNERPCRTATPNEMRSSK